MVGGDAEYTLTSSSGTPFLVTGEELGGEGGDFLRYGGICGATSPYRPLQLCEPSRIWPRAARGDKQGCLDAFGASRRQLPPSAFLLGNANSRFIFQMNRPKILE